MDRKAIVIFYYGGGWRRGERGMYRFVGAALAAQGFHHGHPGLPALPQGRLPHFHRRLGARLCLGAETSQRRGQNRPFVLMGHSAGGHIAALLAVDPRYLAGAPPPAAVVGLAGPYAFDPTTWPRTSDIFRAAAAQPDKARPLAFVSAQGAADVFCAAARRTTWWRPSMPKTWPAPCAKGACRSKTGSIPASAMPGWCWPCRGRSAGARRCSPTASPSSIRSLKRRPSCAR